jgi:hypothetical protein|nr:MAG TPA: putative excisionase [Caudoviricetes sp.]
MVDYELKEELLRETREVFIGLRSLVESVGNRRMQNATHADLAVELIDYPDADLKHLGMLVQLLVSRGSMHSGWLRFFWVSKSGRVVGAASTLTADDVCDIAFEVEHAINQAYNDFEELEEIFDAWAKQRLFSKRILGYSDYVPDWVQYDVAAEKIGCPPSSILEAVNRDFIRHKMHLGALMVDLRSVRAWRAGRKH